MAMTLGYVTDKIYMRFMSYMDTLAVDFEYIDNHEFLKYLCYFPMVYYEWDEQGNASPEYES